MVRDGREGHSEVRDGREGHSVVRDGTQCGERW